PLPGEARRVDILCRRRVLATQAAPSMPNVWVAIPHGSTCVGANSFAVRMITEPRSRCDNHNGIGRLVRRIPAAVVKRDARRMNSPLLNTATHDYRRLGINP